MCELDILFEDDNLIAVNKPSGLLVHPSWIAPRGTPNLTSMLKEYLQGTAYTIHRLDRPTSGVIVFGKNKETAQKMNQKFADREVQKTYLCMTRGYTPEGDVIDYALKEKLDKLADKMSNPDKPAQEAVSEYRRLATVELPMAVGRYDVSRYSLVEVKPKTGRKHQIRRHMKHISHPLIGDTKHGDGRHNKAFRDHFDLERLLLMAIELSFRHPESGELLTIKAPVDPYVDQLFSQFGWSGSYPV
ncbi:tRNA pseudouridine(65) synthase TruC [Pontibacterium sp. N1Y112]|uniref:tRNA pseudouridine synthase C n=1 Tax=Pontibacterium sinense TaxID=2781979 RepID=A0A8J7FAT2_9GAMM|nr:pseudouridine synthase [Pontibacterium sinense]MBE9396306.1 tRNA pseudouridine(65) synthase TruC [Pontibacterium sinense]